MEVFGEILHKCFALFNMPFTIYGYSFTWWQVFVVTLACGVVFKIIWEVVD